MAPMFHAWQSSLPQAAGFKRLFVLPTAAIHKEKKS
jgi:hypothetical protein